MAAWALQVVLATSLSHLAPTPAPVWREPDPNAIPPGAYAHEDLREWKRARARLVSGLVITSATAVAGGVLVGTSLHEGGKDGNAGREVGGSLMIAFGTLGAAVVAPWLDHHLRWDDPRRRVDHPGRTSPEAAALERRRLFIALGSFGGAAVVGTSAWVLPLAIPACEPVYDRACGAAAVGGAAVLAIGATGMVSTGTALLLHRTHHHRLALRPTPTGLSLRF